MKNRPKSRPIYLLVLNIIGIGLYLYFASWVWAPSGDKDFIPAAGDPFVWMLTAFPVLIVCLLTNLGWLVRILFGVRRGEGWMPIRAWALVIIAWIAANRYDAHNHYDGNVPQTVQQVTAPTVTPPEKK